MASRRAQVKAAILVSKKVLFLGRWHTNEVTEDIMQHLRRNLPLVPSQKAKLKLSELGIFFGKRVVLGRTHDEFIPMDRIVQVVPDAVHTTVLLCLVKAGVKSVFDILVFRCTTELDARESAEVFRRLRALSQNGGGTNLPYPQNYYTSTRNNGELATMTSSTTHLSTNGRIIHDGVAVNGNGRPQQSQLIVNQNNIGDHRPPQMVQATLVASTNNQTAERQSQITAAQQQQQQQQQQQHQQQQQPNTMTTTTTTWSSKPGVWSAEEQQKEAILVVTPDPGAVSPNIMIDEVNRHGTLNGASIQAAMDESDAAFKRRMRREVREALKRNRSETDLALLSALGANDSDTGGESYYVDNKIDQVSLADSITAQQRSLNDKVTYIAEEVNRLRSVFETTLRSNNGTTATIGPPMNGHVGRQSSNGQYRYVTARHGRSTSSERSRSRSPGQEPIINNGFYGSKVNINGYNETNYMHSPPLAPGEAFRRRHVVSESTQPLLIHAVRSNGAVRGSVTDLLAASGNRQPATVTVRRGSVASQIPQTASMVRVTIPTSARSTHSINMIGNGGGSHFVGTTSSRVSRQQQRRAVTGTMQRSRSSQWLGGSMAQIINNDYEHTASPDIDERMRRQRDLAERIRERERERREIVRAQMGTVDREKWELSNEPLYLIRPDNRQLQVEAAGAP